MSRTWVTADDGTTPLVEIVLSDDGEGYAARCDRHGLLDTDGRRSLNDVVEAAGNHIDYLH
ncbi:hypothetical protein [Catenuloplanes japonicus]|uniref:hypothetical protein n=1 Tax=Catenuloplanes japonicus TaxID=33876 RepID=UPI000523FC94|nr:hypothetical protein [Catenuloplanes japonicus]